MPGQMTDYMENKVADYFRGQGLTLPSNWYFGLGSAASDSSFTELSGTGYARQALSRSTAHFDNTQKDGTSAASSGTSHATANTSDVSWGSPGGAWGTAAFVGLFDASTSGNCWMWFPTASVVITTGSPNPLKVVAETLLMAFGATGGCSDYLANKLVDLILRGTAYTWPATIYFALHKTTPANSGGGTEVSAGGYARVPLVPSLTSLLGTDGTTGASSGTGGQVSNAAAITFGTPTADWGTVIAGGVYDASTSGNLLFWGAIPSLTVNNGGTPPSFAVGAFTATLD